MENRGSMKIVHYTFDFFIEDPAPALHWQAVYPEQVSKSGPDLMEWILVGSWSDPGWWRTLAKIVDDTLVGLHFMHSRGVFHRDARLENVVFQPDRTICMIDTQIAFVDPDASEIDYAIRFDYGLFLDSLVQTLDGLIWPIRHQSDQARGITERNLLNLRDRLKSNAPDLGQITGRILPEKIRSDVAKTFDHFISQLKPVMRGKLIVTEDETAFSL